MKQLLVVFLLCLSCMAKDTPQQPIIVSCETALVLARKPGALLDTEYSRLFLMNNLECLSLPIHEPKQKSRVRDYEASIKRALDESIEAKKVATAKGTVK